MAFADTASAIGAVTKLLTEQLHTRTGLDIYSGRPTVTSERIQLFLYEASFDPSLKNVPLDENSPSPLWLVLKYIITAYDSQNDSDTEEAHRYVGQALHALQALSFLKLNSALPASILAALKDNPEELKITFDEVPADLISKLMQGPDEKYRFSMGFQVRPIMIASSTPPAYNLLVGVDYTAPAEINEAGIQMNILPSLGPRLEAVDPEVFESGASLTVTGQDLDLEECTVKLSGEALNLVSAASGELVCTVTPPPPLVSLAVSAGTHVLTLEQALSVTRKRTSNPLIVHLLPHLDPAGATFTSEAAEPDNYLGTVHVTGNLLGKVNDDIFLALYQAGKVIRMYNTFEEFSVEPFPEDQIQLSVRIPKVNAPAPGTYRVILRVNGEQARQCPEVVIV